MDRRGRTAEKRGGWHQWTEDEARSALAELARSGESVAVSVERWLYKERRDPTAPALAALDLKLGIVEGSGCSERRSRPAGS
jgi:hypothetical protein